MSFKSTAEYLKALDEIAEIIDKENPSPREIERLKFNRLAVESYELSAVASYPVSELLVHQFNNSKYLLN